jgi:FAD/FMN-containing dehydrogenase
MCKKRRELMQQNTITVKQLEESLRGNLIRPDSPEYDEARAVWNGMIDRQPAMIAKCKGSADVRAAVNYAREHQLSVTVKAGGHNVAGKAILDDALVIDVSPMSSVEIDRSAQTATVGSGAKWADVDRETQAFGLATTGGVDSRTGVAGLTLGGGMGYLARKHGLTIDNLSCVSIVTADGELRRASEKENPDLFWALRGGGGGVGVVTSFEFQLHELGPDVMVAQVFHPFEDARSVLAFYRDFMAEAPNELSCYAMVVHVPPVDGFPEAFHNQMAVALVACYAGSVADGEAVLAPLQSFGSPILCLCEPMPYVSLQQSFDAGTPDGMRYYYKSQYLDALGDDAIEAIVNHVEPLPGEFTIIGIEPMGGAIAEVEPTATAFPHRQAAYNFSVWAGWSDSGDDDEIIEWVQKVHTAMSPHARKGAYLNYLDRDDDPRARNAFGANYDRLTAVRQAWDPDNLFH